MSPAVAVTRSNALDHEFPVKCDLLGQICKPLPKVVPGTVDPASMTGDAPLTQAKALLDTFNTVVSSRDAETLASCFYAPQAFWRDTVALTSHIRTFTTPSVIAAAMLHLVGLRGLAGEKVEVFGSPHFVVINPVMMFIDCEVSFQTKSPPVECMGKLILLPIKIDGIVQWKIWILTTWVEQLVQYPEDEELLTSPGRNLDGIENIETDVLILGGGSCGLSSAARLKALGIDNVVLDKNPRVGDNWANRYDCLKFHLPTSSCELPFVHFPKELQSPHFLTRDEVAEHLRQYAARFHLNIILSAMVHSSTFNEIDKKWTVKVKVANEQRMRTITFKHFIQATGAGQGSSKPFLPHVEGQHLYTGLSQHSVQFRNAKKLTEQGVKSVAVIGSGVTAFDIMQDCYHAGLKTIMVARSPTFVFPVEYVMDPHGLGCYDHLPMSVADRMMNTNPPVLDGQFAQASWAHRASQEPDRYLALSKAGFPVFDSRDASGNFQHYILERGGGHYIDVGGTNLIAEGKVGVRGLVEPVGYSESGLRLSDGSVLEADAVIWCTGYAVQDVRAYIGDMLGTDETGEEAKEGALGPADMSARLDAIWGVDAEGEVRGMWKRHARMDNYWVHGGGLKEHRWWSRLIAQQIKLDLQGALPPAYRETPAGE